jgi:putative transposase
VISDSHEGLKKAASKVLGATWQRCSVHFMRNAMANVQNVKQRGVVAAAIRTAFAQETEKEAHAEWTAVADRLRKRFPRVSALMEEARNDVLAYMSFHKSHWSQIRSTNPLERLNPRSSAAPMSRASSPMRPRSSASLAQSCSSKTTSGP